MLFDIMEKKNKISLLITDIIKATVDCIQNSLILCLNQRHLRPSENYKMNSYLYVNSENLNTIDTKN